LASRTDLNAALKQGMRDGDGASRHPLRHGLIVAQVAMAVTGIAGPGGATPGKPVGTVCFSLIIHQAHDRHHRPAL
jgi:hypothetical protein